jgi:glycerol kinase
MKPYIMAIDQGTTSTRTIIFDKDSNIVSMAQKEIRQFYPKPGWVEHDPNEIWLSVLSTMAKALDQKKISPEDIHAIGITNQRETTVVWEKESGRPVHNAIVWQSRQSAPLCDALKKEGYEPLFKTKTGLVLDPYFSGTKIRWILDNVKDARAKADAGKLAFGTIDSWLVYKLTGQKVHVTDTTNASRTLLFDINSMEWDSDLARILDIPLSMLPKVASSSEIYGHTVGYHFYDLEVPIAGIAGDQQAALFGQTCFEKGSVKNTYGTGCFMLMNTGERPVRSKNGLLSTVAWTISGKTTYALEGSVFVAGSAVQWLRDGLHVIDTASETEPLAQSLADNEGVYIVPAFVGLGTPYWDSEARGAVFGMTRGTDRRHLARAVLESICYQSLDVMRAMETDTGLMIRSFKADGGATGNRFMMQFQSDIMDLPVECPKVLETTALGAAYLAGLSTGFWKSADDIKASWTIGARFDPDMDADMRARNLRGWKEAVSATRGYRPSGKV